jgi:Zn finger protein HypA/HybF involved in hydrogenase expression
MEPITITCEVCGETAIIHKVRYKYVEQAPLDGRPAEHILRETQRDVECPKCGMRTQIERHRDA